MLEIPFRRWRTPSSRWCKGPKRIPRNERTRGRRLSRGSALSRSGAPFRRSGAQGILSDRQGPQQRPDRLCATDHIALHLRLRRLAGCNPHTRRARGREHDARHPVARPEIPGVPLFRGDQWSRRARVRSGRDCYRNGPRRHASDVSGDRARVGARNDEGDGGDAGDRGRVARGKDHALFRPRAGIDDEGGLMFRGRL
jgi:hypothetical protein